MLNFQLLVLLVTNFRNYFSGTIFQELFYKNYFAGTIFQKLFFRLNLKIKFKLIIHFEKKSKNVFFFLHVLELTIKTSLVLSCFFTKDSFGFLFLIVLLMTQHNFIPKSTWKDLFISFLAQNLCLSK